MTFTTHGHHIEGTPLAPYTPENRARCGGPGPCALCSREAGNSRPAFYNEAGNSRPPFYKEFQDLAYRLDWALPDGPEKSVCLSKLLEAKDAAVRAAL